MLEKIPLIIHQIWYQGIQNMPEKYILFSDTWKKQPGFSYEFWDEIRIKDFVSDYPVWNETFERFPEMIQKIDFAKYLILYVYGGIYIDMDVFCIKSLNEFFTLKTMDFIVAEHNTPFLTLTTNKIMGLCGNTLINNAIICSSPQNYRLEKIIQNCSKAVFRKHFLFIPPACRVLVTTGPIIFTNSIIKTDDWKSCILPPHVFEPFNTLEIIRFSEILSENGGKNYEQYMQILVESLTPICKLETFGIHVLDLSWFRNGKNNRMFRIFRKLQKIFGNQLKIQQENDQQ